jgi:hypothetical protein
VVTGCFGIQCTFGATLARPVGEKTKRATEGLCWFWSLTRIVAEINVFDAQRHDIYSCHQTKGSSIRMRFIKMS